MIQIMTAPESERMTDGQIENAVNKLRDAMRKHRGEIGSDVAQQVLGVANIGMLMFAPFRERVEAISNLIVRRVRVNRGRSPQEALDATGRVQYTNRSVVNSMPAATADEVEIVLLKPDLKKYNGHISDDDLEKEFASCVLGPLDAVDPISLASLNEDDPALADKYPNGTHWRGPKGEWNFAAFYHWNGRRKVSVDRSDCDWYDFWWFAGVRKVALGA